MSEDSRMTMWTPNGGVEEEASNFAGVDPRSKRRRSRRRAWRDGLADQTVVRSFEDIGAYRAFERALICSIDPRSAIELELAHRLASLLWRLRRASAVEAGLFEIQGKPLLARRRDTLHGQPEALQSSTRLNGQGGSNGPHEPLASDQEPLSTTMRSRAEPSSKSRTIAECFLRLSNLAPTVLDRVGRYEARLWRQAAQTIWTLDAMRRPELAPMRRAIRKPLKGFYWHAER
jgi:hypothetical protein